MEKMIEAEYDPNYGKMHKRHVNKRNSKKDKPLHCLKK